MPEIRKSQNVCEQLSRLPQFLITFSLGWHEINLEQNIFVCPGTRASFKNKDFYSIFDFFGLEYSKALNKIE